MAARPGPTFSCCNMKPSFMLKLISSKMRVSMPLTKTFAKNLLRLRKFTFFISI
jgi:hypothetical protein